MAGTAGSKVVWFHVRRVQRLPSLHAAHEIPKVQVSRVSHGDALLTVCRGNASYFSFFSPPPVPSRITPGVCGMFVGYARGDQTEFRFAFFRQRKMEQNSKSKKERNKIK